MKRRSLLHMIALGTAGAKIFGGSAPAFAQDGRSVTIGWPSDVPNWDPNQRFQPDAQPLYKSVFDQPIEQDADLNFVPSLFTEWDLAEDGLSLSFSIRDDVVFHDGTPMTIDDIRFTFYERVAAGEQLDIANTWGNLEDIEILSPTTGVFRFSAPTPTAPQWLAFMGSFVVPKAYMEEVGLDGFRERPIGTGPYKLVEYQMNSRIVLERHEDYWGEKPAIERVTINIIRDPSARVAAVQSGQAHLTINVPVREVERLGAMPQLEGEINPITRVILLQLRHDMTFDDQNIRLAAHHAIDKAALSRAFYGDAAVPLSVVAPPGTPGYVEGFEFAHDPDRARELLAASGYSPDNPVQFTMATTNGHFPSDYDIARALVQMWGEVGIEVSLDVIEYARYFELNRGNQLPEATLYSWDNATGDPEIFTGYLLNPRMPFSSWKADEPGNRVLELFAEPDYETRIAGYRELNRQATEMGATIPLLQSVQTLVRDSGLSYRRYGNGWVLPATMSWS